MYTVLHVEDEQNIQILVRTYCKKEFGDQVHVINAMSVHEALVALRKYGGADLVITDYNLGGKRTGGDLLEIVMTDAQWPGIPVVIASSESLECIQKKHPSIKGVQLLQKPFPLKELGNVFREYLTCLA